MVLADGADSVTVSTALTVPELPSVTVTSPMLIDGASAAGQSLLFSSTETSLELAFAAAASTRPSPLKSPTATATGFDPSAEVTGGRKVPVPVPINTLTLPP